MCLSQYDDNVVVVSQAYTSQFVALVLFALVMCEDKISVQPRRNEILKGLQQLPGETMCDLWMWSGGPFVMVQDPIHGDPQNHVWQSMRPCVVVHETMCGGSWDHVWRSTRPSVAYLHSQISYMKINYAIRRLMSS